MFLAPSLNSTNCLHKNIPISNLNKTLSFRLYPKFRNSILDLFHCSKNTWVGCKLYFLYFSSYQHKTRDIFGRLWINNFCLEIDKCLFKKNLTDFRLLCFYLGLTAGDMGSLKLLFVHSGLLYMELLHFDLPELLAFMTIILWSLKDLATSTPRWP